MRNLQNFFLIAENHDSKFEKKRHEERTLHEYHDMIFGEQVPSSWRRFRAIMIMVVPQS